SGLVLCPEDPRLVRGHEIEVGAAQQFVALAAHDGAERIIEKNESVLFILDEDGVGNGVDDVRQELACKEHGGDVGSVRRKFRRHIDSASRLAERKSSSHFGRPTFDIRFCLVRGGTLSDYFKWEHIADGQVRAHDARDGIIALVPPTTEVALSFMASAAIAAP